VKTHCIPAAGSATVLIIPSGGGAPSGGLKTTVETYIESKTQFGLMPVTADDPTYNGVNITATYTTRTGFVSVTVGKLLEFALTLASCAYDVQVIDSYNDNGISTCRADVINNLWAWAFSEAEEEALAFIIDKWIDLLGTREFRDFGQVLEVGDLWIIGDSLYDYGVDEFNLTAPSSNVSVSSDEIIDTGTLNITES
jgi:hypothetical protein